MRYWLLAPFFLCGCSVGGGSAGSSPNQVGEAHLTEVRILGTVDEPVTATVNDLADVDGVVDESFAVDFQLDDGPEATSLPADDQGSGSTSYEFTVSLEDSVAQQVERTITVTLDP